MQPDARAAIDALSNAIAALLPAPPDSDLAPQVEILPTLTRLSGIGGHIGPGAAPVAERRAQRIEGEIVVRVFSDSAAGLLEAEAALARELIGADPDLLRRGGILRLRRVAEGQAKRLEQADGIAAAFGQDVRFAVAFEHAPLPAAGEGTIDAVLADTMLGGTGRVPRLRYRHDFLSDPLEDFPAFAAGGPGTAPAWAWDEAAQELRQTGERRGGVDGLSENKAGGYLVLRDARGGGPLGDFLLETELRSDGPGGIGLVFRFRDPQNFGFVLLEGPPGQRLFGRRADNNGAFFAEGGQDLARGFPPETWLRLRLLAQGDRFELAIDGVPVLAGSDPDLKAPGSVGFFCRGNPNARFRHLRVTGL